MNAHKPHALARLGLFMFATCASYVVLAMVFGLYCLVGGHNMMEALYGGFATYVLALAVGAEAAFFMSDG